MWGEEGIANADKEADQADRRGSGEKSGQSKCKVEGGRKGGRLERLRVKKILILLLVATVPVLLSLEVWQVFRYRKLSRETLELEAQQKDWLEKNKKVLANISLFSSPERIEKLSREALGLQILEGDRVLTIEIGEE